MRQTHALVLSMGVAPIPALTQMRLPTACLPVIIRTGTAFIVHTAHTMSRP